MRIPRDIIFHKDLLISYYQNLRQFVGKKCTQKELEVFFQKKYPLNPDYNTLSRRFKTLKFYGFVYFSAKGELMFNEHFEEYVNYLQKGIIEANCFSNILRSSKNKYYENNTTNFFELLIRLLNDNSILYLDHIDIITYLQHYDLINNYDELVRLIKNNRNYKFAQKVLELETFYNTHNLGNIAITLHDAKYLFSFLEKNGFYILKNSLQSKKYFQGLTGRKLEDRRLYLSKGLLKHINGFSYESIVDEMEYNSEIEIEMYADPDKDVTKLINKSDETQLAIVRRYKTDAKLRNNALEKSGYLCEMANLKGLEHKTFHSRIYDGDYAEVHHLIPMHAQEDDLFINGDKLISLDQISNLVVLCPTCHSKLHYGKNDDVMLELEILFDNRKKALHENQLIVNKTNLLGFYNINNKLL